MTKELLFESMEYLDDALLERSEKNKDVIRTRWGKWLAAAACLCLVLAGAYGLPRLLRTGGDPRPVGPFPSGVQGVPPTTTDEDPSATCQVAVHFNPITQPPETANFVALSGRALTGEERSALLPASPEGTWMDDLKALEVNSWVELFGWGEPYQVRLRFRDKEGLRVDLALRDASSPYASYGMFYPVTPEKFLTTQVEGVEVTGYRYTFEETGDTMLWATFERDGVAYWFTALGDADTAKTVQAYIEGMVLWYLSYPVTVDLGAYAN